MWAVVEGFFQATAGDGEEIMERSMKHIFVFVALILAGCAAEVEQPQAGDQPKEERWQAIAKEFPAGRVNKNIFTIAVPRSDLEVGHIDLGEIPIDAGLSSTIYFFPCPCGKM